MKRRDKDRIIDLAFGEVPDSEAGRLEQYYNSDPVASQTLSQFKRLKSDLPLLNSIPDHQISTERLREAILRGGLKQKRNYWTWSVVPALAAAASLFLLLPRTHASQSVAQIQSPTPETTVAFEAAPVQEGLFHPETELTNLNHAVRSTYSYGSSANGDEGIRAEKLPEKHRHGYEATPELSSSVVALSNADQSGDTVVPPAEAPPSDQPASQVPVDLTAAPKADDTSAAEMNDSQKLIVVHDAEDNSTGAQQATEVEPTSNVVVGG